jgi:GTP-binding protein
MLIKSARFVKSAAKPSQYPPASLPEIVFAGRSNVGKSSLINTLVNRKRLAKTGATPGRTQLINFFSINEVLVLVDIPGYGYARVPGSVRRRWAPMVEAYFSSRRTLKAAVLIMDIRRTPGPEEVDLIKRLGRDRIPVVPVLTKSDKLSRAKQALQRRQAALALGLELDRLILFSARTRIGVEALWEAVLAHASPAADPPGAQ